MNALASQIDVRPIQGFAAYVLNNGGVELAVVPELGAKIISLKNLRSGREWLWHPREDMKLFRNHPFDDFAASPLVGIDECLPTIKPCVWRGRSLADHGEAWNQPWQVDDASASSCILALSLRLKNAPLLMRRTVQLAGNEVRLDYRLTNVGREEEPFIWALHPLLRLQAGDTLVLPNSTRELLNGNVWGDAVASAIPEQNCAKVFAHPVREGRAAITNRSQSDRLEFVWNPEQNSALGLWLTRGGWHGHHHFAIEPTNASDDSLAVAAAHNRCGVVAGGGTVSWQLTLRIGSPIRNGL